MKVENVIKKLSARGFVAEYAATADEAKEKALRLIGNASCGFGGSVTVRDLGIYEALKENGNEVFWHWASPEQKDEMHAEAMRADFYISSTNALTEDGVLVNTDGTGNRIASMFFGPKKVIIIAGINKIVPDIEAAQKRIKEIAAPLNAKRLGLKTPCAKTENCLDCSSRDRICKVMLYMEAPSAHTEKVYVIIAGQEMGY